MLSLPTVRSPSSSPFTDIEGSTRLLQHLGDGYADALAQYRHLLRSTVQERGDQEVDTRGYAGHMRFVSGWGAKED
jgi:hypothetical protein